MKYNLSKNNFFLILLFILFLRFDLLNTSNLAAGSNLKSKTKTKSKTKKLNLSEENSFTSKPIIVEAINSKNQDDNVIWSKPIKIMSSVIKTNSPIQVIPSGETILLNAKPMTEYVKPVMCPCQAMVKCNPCGILVKQPPIYCPCAPKPNCPVCPPISVIHEIAAKKAIQDQKMASNLRKYVQGMDKLLDSISKFYGEIIKYETSASKSARNMEQAGIKSQIARNKMLKVIIYFY